MTNYRYSYDDLDYDGISHTYKFKDVKVSERCYRLLRRLIADKKDECEMWLYDADNKRIEETLPLEEISMIDGLFTWGFNEWDDDFGSANLGPCRYPQSHDFEKKAYTTWFFRECKKCGYSPELDHSKPDFDRCHKEFMEWETRLKK